MRVLSTDVRHAMVVAGLVAAGLLGTSGCPLVLIGAGAGAVAYLEGDLKSVEPHTRTADARATERVLRDQKIIVVSQKYPDQVTTEITARTAEDKKITIVLTEVNAGTTRISIRVGVFGDETFSRQIYQKIHDRLQ